MINVTVTENDVKVALTESSQNESVEIPGIIYDRSNDYERLANLPKLNGQTIIGDMSEIDPTVPAWAKEETKPSYTPSEIGAVDAANAISIEDLAKLFNS